MKERTVSAVLALPILFLVLFSNNLVIGISLLLLSLIGIKELYSSFDNTEYKLDNNFRLIGFTSTILLYIAAIFFSKNIMILILVISIFFIVAYGMFTFNNKTLANISTTILSILYIPFSFWFIYSIYTFSLSSWLVGYVFLIAFISDTCAYFVGVLFGKKKVTPKLSPNKSLEGFLGGMIGGIISTLLYSLLLNYFNIVCIDINTFTLFKVSVFGLIGAMVSQIGDLLASSIKRTNGIKDFGNIMPGHGGVLDRFDSILLVAPYVYFTIHIILMN